MQTLDSLLLAIENACIKDGKKVLPQKAIIAALEGKKPSYKGSEEIEEIRLLSIIKSLKTYNSLVDLLVEKSSISLWTIGSFKYEVKPEDIVNALVNLEDLIVEYFNLDRQEKQDEYDESIDPDNRHLGERNLVPASMNENVTIEISRGKSVAELISELSKLTERLRNGLLENMQNPQDVNDERVTDPEAVKESDLVEIEPDLPPGPIESLLESPDSEVRDVLPGEATSPVINEEVEEEAKDPEPYPVNENGGLQSSGEAYLSTPPDVRPEGEDDDAEEEKEKANCQSTETAEDAKQGTKAKETKEDIDLPGEGGPGAQDPEDIPGISPGHDSDTSTTNVGWYGSASFFDSKSLSEIMSRKGLDHFKASDGGMIGVNSYGSFSNFGKKSVEDYYPTDEELGEINANHSLIDMKKEHLIVLPIVAADTNIDRGSEHFTLDGLESFVPLYKGKTLLLDHNWTTGSEIGRIFDAKVMDNKLMVKAYIPITEHNHKLISNILAGVHGRVSVGFSMDVRNVTCDSCACSMRKGPPTLNPFNEGTVGYAEGVSIFDEDLCPHKPGAIDEYGNKTTVTLHRVADVMELSIVPVPMQPRAGMSRTLTSVKSAISEIEKITSSIERSIKEVNSTKDEPSNIISSRTMGEKAVSDLTAPRTGGEGAGEAMSPEAAGPFDVKGNETRPTDDNIFARAAIKNLHDASEVLKGLTSELVEIHQAQKATLEELKALYDKGCGKKEEDDEDMEEKAKVAVLEEAVKALTETLKKVNSDVSSDEPSTKEYSLEAETWAKSLINDFNKSLGGK